MANEVSIEDFQNELQELLTSDPDNFSDNIDKFNIDNLMDYWNISVQKFYDKLKEFFETDESDSPNACKYDAATKDKKYVKPFINKNEENYLDSRNDEIKEVLENYNKMDFTIEDYKYITSEIKRYVTKLIMPQNSRYVEVEDLNRNFWIIGNNLTLLNDFMMNIGNELVKQLIGELTGLWDNVYRIWQALYYLNNLIDNTIKNEKLHISLKYDSSIIPYIKSTTVGDRTVNYVIYNDYINSIFEKTQEELINILTTKNNLIYIDYNKIQTDLKMILKILQEKNFALISFGAINQDTQWDLLSLSFTHDISNNIDSLINKTLKLQHLWIDFVSQDLSCGTIISYTENNLGNQKELLSYDYELTIPMVKNCECKYQDFVRFNKPYPNLQKVKYNSSSIDRINSLNDNNNWIGYEDDRTAVDGTYGYIDGFYGLNMSQYPLEENININNYSTYFKLSKENLFPIQFSSSDLINTQHEHGGQSRIINKHGNNVNNISVNLRYINGRNNIQEVELITTKDVVGGASQKFKKILSAENVYLGGIYNNNPNGEDSPSDDNYYLQFILANNYRSYSHTESIYRAPSNITDDDTNIFWVPIKEVKDRNREKNGQANSIDVIKIWNNPILQKAIIGRVKELVGQGLKNYEYKIVNIYYSCFNAGTNSSAGTHYSHLLLVYREMGDVYVEEICPLDYSVCFFNGSSLSEAAAEYSKIQGNGYSWDAIEAYCAITFQDGFYSYHSGSFLTLEGLSVEGGLKKSIAINKMTIGLTSKNNVCYEIWGKVLNKKWTIEGAIGTPLKEYTISDTLEAIKYDKPTENLCVGRNDNDHIYIESTNIKLYNSPTDYLSPWSNPKKGIGWKEWGYQPGA